MCRAISRVSPILFIIIAGDTWESRSRKRIYSWPVANVSHEIRERNSFSRARSTPRETREESRRRGATEGCNRALKQVPEAYLSLMDGGLSLVIRARDET